MVLICIKQQLSKFEAKFITNKVKIKAELKKSLLVKNVFYLLWRE